AAAASRSCGGAWLTMALSSRWLADAISSTARAKAASLAFAGLVVPAILRTNCSEASRTSSAWTGGSTLWSRLMFRHMAAIVAAGRAPPSADIHAGSHPAAPSPAYRGRMRRTPAPVVLLISMLLGGCVSLQPWSEVRARLPAAELVEVDGHTVHVEQWGGGEQRGPAGDPGEAVVLLHGFGESTYSWRLVAPQLAQRHRVVAVDLNGFGYTERRRDPAAYTIDGQMRLVLGALDRLGIQRADFVGHSYGGGLTLWIAAHHPERVRSMALLDSTMPRYSATRRSRAANLRALTYVYLRTVAMRPGYVQKSLRASYGDDALATPEVARAYLD